LEEPIRFGNPELLIELVKANIAEDSWSDKRTTIAAVGEELIVVQTPESHAKIAQLIATLRRETEIQIAVEGTVALVENTLLDELRLSAPHPAALTDAAWKALAEALAKGERAATLCTLHLTARNGQLVSHPVLSQHHYIKDYDVEASKEAVAMDPRIGCLQLGDVLAVRPMFARGHLACDVRFSRHAGTIPIPRFETGLPGMGPLELPETDLSVVGTTVAGKDGQTLLVGRVGVADPKAPGAAPARSLC
jgi:hypothetical protein